MGSTGLTLLGVRAFRAPLGMRVLDFRAVGFRV